MHSLSHTHMLISLTYAYIQVHTHTHTCPLTCTRMYLSHTHIYISPSFSHTYMHTLPPHTQATISTYTHKTEIPSRSENSTTPLSRLSSGINGKEMTSSESCMYCAPSSLFSGGHRCSCLTESWVFHLGQIWSIYRLFSKPGQLLSWHVPLPAKSFFPSCQCQVFEAAEVHACITHCDSPQPQVLAEPGKLGSCNWGS